MAAERLSSVGVIFGYSTTGFDAEDFIEVEGCYECPSLGGSREKLDATALKDTVRRKINGIKDYGDELQFKCYYDSTEYDALDALTDTEVYWTLKFPNNKGTFTWTGSPSVSLDGFGVSALLAYSLNIAPSSDITKA